MYVSHETVLNPVHDYECIGAGSYLAKYLIRQYRAANENANAVEDAELIAAIAVKSAIDYDESCGGKAELLIMSDADPSSKLVEAAPYPDDDFTRGLQRSTFELLHSLAHVKDKIYGAENDSKIEKYIKDVRELNESLKLSYFKDF